MSRPVPAEMPRVYVKAASDNLRVPVEGHPGSYFAPGEVRNMRLTPFVQRLIKDGDLVEADPPPDAAPAATPGAPAPAAEHQAAGESVNTESKE